MYNNFRRLSEQIDVLKLVWLAFKSLLGPFINTIVLVVQMIEFQQTKSGSLLFLIHAVQEINIGVQLLEEIALVPESVEIIHGTRSHILESLLKLIVKLFNIIDQLKHNLLFAGSV